MTFDPGRFLDMKPDDPVVVDIPPDLTIEPVRGPQHGYVKLTLNGQSIILSAGDIYMAISQVLSRERGVA